MRWFPVLMVYAFAVVPVSGNPGYFEQSINDPGVLCRGAELIGVGAAGVVAGLIAAMTAGRMRWRTRLVLAVIGGLLLWVYPLQPDRTGEISPSLSGKLSASAPGPSWFVKHLPSWGNMPLLIRPAGGSGFTVQSSSWSEKYSHCLDDGWFSATVRRAKERRYSRHVTPGLLPPPPVLDQLDSAVALSVAAARSGQADVAEAALARAFPGKVTRAMVLELAGDLAGALTYASKNPGEWVHARVLESRIRDQAAGRADPAVSVTGGVESYPEGQGTIHRLREYCVQRVMLFPAPDLTTARVLRDSAEFLVKDEPASVHATLELAREYGLPGEIAAPLNRMAEERIRLRLVEENRSPAAFQIFRWRIWIVAVLGVAIGISLAWRSRRRAIAVG